MIEQPLSVKRTFPTFLLTSSLVFNILVFVWIGVHIFNAYHTIQRMAHNEFRIAGLRQNIVYLDEVLTMSARMSAVTGDLFWEERYLRYGKLLDSSIADILGMTSDNQQKKVLEQTYDANQQLVAIEKAAFALVHEKKLEKAKNLLFNSDYEQQKKRYAQGIERYTVYLQKQIEKSINTQKNNTYHLLLFTSIVVFMLACTWILALKSIHRWRHTLEEAKQIAEQANLQLEKTLKELEQSNIELERFAYIASHDLQEPLRTVYSFVQLLMKSQEETISAEKKTYIKHIEEGLQRMRTLTSDLLAYSQLTNKSRAYTVVDCNHVLAQAMQALTAAITQKAAVISHDPLPLVLGEETQLFQLFQNLLNNALKYSSPDIAPVIHVSVMKNGDFWVFSVKDNGIGIEAEYLESIFSLFTRLHSMRDYTGAGIGLATCKKIVEAHGGRIWAESVPGQGSRFCFTLSV